MIAWMNWDHDYMADLLAALTAHSRGQPYGSTSLWNMTRPYTARGSRGAWRREVRPGMIDLVQSRDAWPLPKLIDGDRLALP